MAKTPEEYISEYQASIAVYDPSADTTKGPIYDWIIAPNSSILSNIEERQDRTDRLTSADFASAATSEELERMAGAVGAGTPEGVKATTTQTFGTYSRPKSGEIISIPQGTLVSSLDGLLVYQTTEPGEINGSYPDVYLNQSRRTYEIKIPIEAVAAGVQYNLPPFRIRKMLAPINGIDYTENKFDINDGKSQGDNTDLLLRAQSKFSGQNSGSIGGIESSIMEAFQESVLGVSVVTSTDRMLFRRLVDKPGIDIYIAGQLITESEYSFVASGGEIDIALPNKPVQSIIDVFVNGQTVSYTFEQDDSLSYGGSTSDSSYIRLSTALSVGAFILIRYRYDSLVSTVHASYGNINSLFETDTIVRRAARVHPVIRMYIKSSINQFAVKRNVESYLIKFFETSQFGITYLASVLEDGLQDNVIGLSGRPVIEVFQPFGRAYNDIQPISLRNNEICVVDFDKIQIITE